MNQPYKTTELEIAAFLKARGHRLIEATPHGAIVEFAYPPDATPEVDAYFSGAEIRAQELFEAHRSLRALILQIKKHNQNGVEKKTWKQPR
jgi:hypothetical protein